MDPDDPRGLLALLMQQQGSGDDPGGLLRMLMQKTEGARDFAQDVFDPRKRRGLWGFLAGMGEDIQRNPISALTPVGDFEVNQQGQELSAEGHPVAGGLLQMLGAGSALASVVPIAGVPARSASRQAVRGVTEFAEKWKAQGVRNWISESDDALVLNEVVVPSDLRGQGIGSQFMEELVALADEQGKPVLLTSSNSLGGSSVRRLNKFYRRFGFQPNKGPVRDHALPNEEMIRLPHGGG